MSSFTASVRTICESYAGLDTSTGYSQVEEVVRSAAPYVFDFTYPLYSGVDKQRFESMILLNYYNREIGLETVGAWKLRLMVKLREIMPYYNQLYESVDLKFNPLDTADYYEDTLSEHDGNRTNNNSRDNTETRNDDFTRTDNLTKSTKLNQTTTSSQSGQNEDQNIGTVSEENKGNESSSGTRKYSNTPQGGLTGLQADEYLTEAEMTSTSGNDSSTTTTTRNDGTIHKFGQSVNDSHTANDLVQDTGTVSNKGSATTTGKNTEKMSMQEKFMDTNTKWVHGKLPGESFAKLLQEYREAIINVDQMVVESLSDLFMGLW